MQIVDRSALLTYTAAQMFDLVNDVARYPEFLPWCVGAQVEEHSSNERKATLRIAHGVLKAQFSTLNHALPNERIEMRLTDGPFRELTGEWRFENIGERGSRVGFRIEFEFNNRLTAAAFGAVFESLCGSIVDAFAQRAREVYES